MTDDPLIGRDIEGRYKIVEKLGAGGMGVVYRAHHALLNVDVALKVIHPRFGETPEARERFLREARAATALTHRNIVAVREVGEFDGKLYLTMDLVKGRTLQDVMARDGRMSIGRAAAIVGQILDALEEAHGRGIVHRDLKPGNIMLEEGDAVRVLDFGLAKWIGDSGSKDQLSSLTGSGMTVGTLQYMSPEQVAGDPVDGRSDLYAAAVILYQLLTGTPPHVAESNQALMRKIVLEPPRPISELGAFPPGLASAVMRGLEKDAKNRPANAAEFRRLLEGAGGLTATAMRAMPTMERPVVAREVVLDAEPARRAPWAIIAAAVVLVGAGGFFGWRYLQSQKYERHIREGRAAVDDKRWADAATAFESAQKVEDSAEAASGMKRARFEQKKEAAKKARSLDEAVTAWEEAAKYGDVDEELRATRARRDLAAGAKAVDAGDIDAADRALKGIDVGALEVDKRTELQGLSQRLAKLKEEEGAAARRVDEALKGGEVFAERSAWQDYVKAFAKGPRGAEGQKRLREIEEQISKGPGLLIDVEPRGANVYLNGTKVGVSPMLLRDVAAGPHRVLLSAESYDSVEKDIEMAKGGRIDVKLALAPLVGDVKVSTNAPGADVYLEGKQGAHAKADAEGRAVFEKVLIGSWTVRAEAKGFDAAKQTVDVKPKQPTDVVLTLVEHSGTLIVKTNPPGLTVKVDGTSQKSPVRFEKRAAGPVDVVVTDAEGFENTVAARVRGDEETVVDVDMVALAAEQAKPYDALAQIARTRDPEDILKACDEFLAAHPAARASAEVKRVKRALEFLTGRQTVKPIYDVELPPLLKNYKSPGWTVPKGELDHLEFGSSGKRLFFCRKGEGDSDPQANSLHIFNFDSGVMAGPFPNDAGSSNGAPSHTGRYLCWARNGSIEIYETASGKRSASVSYGKMDPTDYSFWGAWTWAEDDRYLLYSGSVSNATDSWSEIQAYDPTTGAQSWKCKDQQLQYPEAETITERYGIVYGNKKGLINLSGGYVESDATGEYDFRNIAYHFPSRRVAFYIKKENAEALSVNLYDYVKGIKQKDFEIPANLSNLEFSPDGTRLWGWEGGYNGETAKAAVGVSIDDPSSVTRIGIDLSRQRAILKKHYLMMLSRSTTTAADPFERVELYSTASGKRVVEIPGTWTSPDLQDSSDAHMIYLREKERHVVADARTGKVLFDRKGSDINGLTPICATGSYILRTNEGSFLYAPGAEKPTCKAAEGQVYYEWGLVISPDNSGYCNGFGGLDSYPSEIKIHDARTMAPLLADRAFLHSLGSSRVHRHGSFWIQENRNGRLRLWKEIDILNAIAPEGADLRVVPGALSAAIEEYFNDQPEPTTVVKPLAKEKMSEDAAQSLESFVKGLSAGDAAAVSRGFDDLMRQVPKRFTAPAQALILSEAGAAWKAGTAKEPAMAALADAILRAKWDLNAVTRLELLPNARAMKPLIVPLFETTTGDAKSKVINRLSELEAAEFLPKVIDALSDPEWSVRYAARNFVQKHGGAQHLQRVLQLLAHSNKDVRETGLEFLGDWKLPETVPNVVGMLKDAEDSIRRKALTTLGYFKNPELATHVVPYLKDPDQYVRVAAVDALQNMGANAAAGDIEPLLNDPEAYVVSDVVEALAELDHDRYVDRIIEAMSHKDPGVRSAAFRSIRPGLDAARLDRIAEFLKDPEKRLQALSLLVSQGRKEHVAALAEYLLDADKSVRSNTADFLGKFGDRTAVPRLRAALKDAEANVRSYAVTALKNVQARDAVPDLLALLKDPSSGVRNNVVNALATLGRPEDAPALVPALKDENEWTRYYALQALVAFDATAYVKEIEPCIEDPNTSVASTAVNALATLAYDQSVDRLIPCLTHKNESVRSAAAAALRPGLDAARQAKIAELLNAPEHRLTALRALVAQGRKDLVPDLAALLTDGNVKVRQTAASALIGCGDETIIPTLRKALKDEDESVIYSAALALGERGAREAIPDLLLLLQDARSSPVAGAIGALGELGAKEHLEKIVALLGHKESWVRASALYALEKLGDPKIADRAIAFTKDESSPYAAFWVLRRLDARSGATAVANALTDPKQPHRSYAAQTLVSFLARGDDGKGWLGALEKESSDAAVRQAARIVLIAASRVGKADQRAMLEDLGPGHAMTPFLMVSLGTVHEKSAAQILESVVEVKEDLEGMKGLTTLAEAHGFKLEFDPRTYTASRFKRGAKGVLADKLGVYGYQLVPDGKTLRLLRPRAAYEHWLDRLKP